MSQGKISVTREGDLQQTTARAKHYSKKSKRIKVLMGKPKRLDCSPVRETAWTNRQRKHLG